MSDILQIPSSISPCPASGFAIPLLFFVECVMLLQYYLCVMYVKNGLCVC